MIPELVREQLFQEQMRCLIPAFIYNIRGRLARETSTHCPYALPNPSSMPPQPLEHAFPFPGGAPQMPSWGLS